MDKNTEGPECSAGTRLVATLRSSVEMQNLRNVEGRQKPQNLCICSLGDGCEKGQEAGGGPAQGLQSLPCDFQMVAPSRVAPGQSVIWRL